MLIFILSSGCLGLIYADAHIWEIFHHLLYPDAASSLIIMWHRVCETRNSNPLSELHIEASFISIIIYNVIYWSLHVKTPKAKTMSHNRRYPIIISVYGSKIRSRLSSKIPSELTVTVSFNSFRKLFQWMNENATYSCSIYL